MCNLKPHRKLCQSIHNVYLDQIQIMEKYNVSCLFRYYPYLLLHMPLLIACSRAWDIWLFKGKRWVWIFWGDWEAFLLNVNGVSGLPTCQSRSRMKNTPGSWKSPAKAPVPCSVLLAGAWSERGKLTHTHSPGGGCAGTCRSDTAGGSAPARACPAGEQHPAPRCSHLRSGRSTLTPSFPSHLAALPGLV